MLAAQGTAAEEPTRVRRTPNKATDNMEMIPMNRHIARAARVLTALGAAAALALGAAPANAHTGPEHDTAALWLHPGGSLAGTPGHFASAVAAEVRETLVRRGGALDVQRLDRIRRLPSALRAPMLSRTLTDRNRDGYDDDGWVGFWTGTRASRVSLHLPTGALLPGGVPTDDNPAPQVVGPRRSVRGAYGALHQTLVFFDSHYAAYGVGPRSTDLVRRVTATVAPTIAAEIPDANLDGRVDNGRIVLRDTTTGRCATVTLPQHDPHRERWGSLLDPRHC